MAASAQLTKRRTSLAEALTRTLREKIRTETGCESILLRICRPTETAFLCIVSRFLKAETVVEIVGLTLSDARALGVHETAGLLPKPG
jgi:hypothetical protein